MPGGLARVRSPVESTVHHVERLCGVPHSDRMDGAQVHYFGYGSLVNRATRPAGERAIDAHLPGWQRVWNHRVGAERAGRIGCTSLSIEPIGGVAADVVPPAASPGIDGVIVAMNAAELPGLDERESGYERLALPASAFIAEAAALEEIGLTLDATVHLYRSLPVHRHYADPAHPILQTYVDCVMAGYLDRFGLAGLDAFLDSSTGWHGMRRDDRQAPGYPRAQALSRAVLERIDGLLAQRIDRCDHSIFADPAA